MAWDSCILLNHRPPPSSFTDSFLNHLEMVCRSPVHCIRLRATTGDSAAVSSTNSLRLSSANNTLRTQVSFTDTKDEYVMYIALHVRSLTPQVPRYSAEITTIVFLAVTVLVILFSSFSSLWNGFCASGKHHSLETWRPSCKWCVRCVCVPWLVGFVLCTLARV